MRIVASRIIMRVKQFVPAEYCGKCDVCCRFLDEETPLAPAGLSLVPYKDRFICRNFNPASNKCKDYENRPLDCQLYPFVVMWDENYKDVVLGLDTKCPYTKGHKDIPNEADSSRTSSGSRRSSKEVSTFGTRSQGHRYKDYLIPLLKDIEPQYILRFQDDVEILERLDIKTEPVLNKLLIGDKALFEKYADKADKPFSSYSFAANYLWTELLDYYWTIIDANFCLFCKTQNTIFMPIPPITPRGCDLGKTLSKKAVAECFKLMNKLNKNKNCSRIEDIPEKDVKFFKGLGYKIKEKGCEYIYRQKDLTNLAGDKYKPKRALCNYFVKNYKFEYRAFKKEDKEACLELFKCWSKERGEVYNYNYYRNLLLDSYAAHKKAMDRFRDLGLAGRVVVVDNKLSAYTFGYPLNKETFIILFEVADLNPVRHCSVHGSANGVSNGVKIKGLSQFIFREFCREAPATYMNLMDDSGLENLKKVKLSYHPVKAERTFCAQESR